MTPGTVTGVALLVAAMVWWLVSGALLDRVQRPAPLSGRAWVGYFVYAVGTFPAFMGVSRLEDEGGWSTVAIGFAAAAGVVLVGFLAILLVLRARRRVRSPRGNRR